jgi:aminopeptidase N
MPISSTGPYSEDADKLDFTSFLPTPKMSSYLFAWVVGEFDCVSGSCYGGKMPVNVFSIKGKANSCHYALKVFPLVLKYIHYSFHHSHLYLFSAQSIALNI